MLHKARDHICSGSWHFLIHSFNQQIYVTQNPLGAWLWAIPVNTTDMVSGFMKHGVKKLNNKYKYNKVKLHEFRQMLTGRWRPSCTLYSPTAVTGEHKYQQVAPNHLNLTLDWFGYLILNSTHTFPHPHRLTRVILLNSQQCHILNHVCDVNFLELLTTLSWEFIVS